MSIKSECERFLACPETRNGSISQSANLENEQQMTAHLFLWHEYSNGRIVSRAKLEIGEPFYPQLVDEREILCRVQHLYFILNTSQCERFVFCELQLPIREVFLGE